MTRTLITGAGGPAAICFFQAIQDAHPDVVMADMDVYAAGLYLVPEDRRVLLPAGCAPGFVDALLHACITHEVTRLVPTVDAELRPIAQRRADFEAAGIELMLAPLDALETCLDKHALFLACQGFIPCPDTVIAGEKMPAGKGPWIAKPRSGSGSRGIRMVTRDELHTVPHDGEWLLQELLPGAEYSVDVLVNDHGKVLAAVPRERLKVDSGVAVAARTVRDPELERFAARAASLVGIRGVANVQLKRDRFGVPRLMEINPRFPGTMALTVTAGANLPKLNMALMDGVFVTPPVWNEVAIVRTLTEHVVDPAAFDLHVTVAA